MRTARQLADEVWEAQQEAWEFNDPVSSILAADRLNPDDEGAVRRIAAANGYTGKALDSMSRRVSALVVGRVGALADATPAMAGD
jgi:hypothetical protein